MQWQEITGETKRETTERVRWIEVDPRATHYRTLGVAPSVSALSLKQAFYRLAARHHPDKHQGDARAAAETRMKELNAAYSVLRLPHSRARYDASIGL